MKPQQFPKKILNLLISSSSVIILLLAWEIFSKTDLIHSLYFPAPSMIISRLFYLLFNKPSFSGDILASSYRLLIGTLISVPPALILGVAIGLNKYVELFFKPLIAVTYPIPKLAVFPLLLLIFGLGDASKIAIIAIGVFFLVLLNTIHGIHRLFSSGYLDIVVIYRIPFLKKMFRIVILGTLPEILNGIKIGMGYGLVMVVAGEFSTSRNGIGFFIWNAWDQFRITDLYCGLTVLSVMGFVIFFLIDVVKNNLKGFHISGIE